jgi:hypothetical protein
MFIGTRRRKTIRKGQNISGDLQPIKMDPGSSPGVTGAEGPRIRPAFFSVIPAEAGIHVHRNETAEDYPEGAKYLR